MVTYSFHLYSRSSHHFIQKEKMAGGEGGGGDYSREAIISNISVKGGRLIEGGD